ncbi:type II toxin-antitoxin system RelN family antitoxin [Anabaena sp. WFMT]|uniref:type II toxin-antitoxin system RelN family antitoxin n=1 Tax=Anabaena sp. WFMT TaxID=3449730 RepID=UPI003F226064
MKAIKVMATVDEQGSLSLDQPLSIIQNSRVEVIVLIPEAIEIGEDYEPMESKEEILQDFRQAWHEAMTGKTIPVSQLWEEIENV